MFRRRSRVLEEDERGIYVKKSTCFKGVLYPDIIRMILDLVTMKEWPSCRRVCRFWREYIDKKVDVLWGEACEYQLTLDYDYKNKFLTGTARARHIPKTMLPFLAAITFDCPLLCNKVIKRAKKPTQVQKDQMIAHTVERNKPYLAIAMIRKWKL